MATRHRCLLIVYVFAVLASGWLGVGIDALMHAEPGSEQSLGMGIWLVFPLLSAAIFWLVTRSFGVGIRPRFRQSWACWLSALCVFPIVSALSVVLARAFGGVSLAGLNLVAFGSAFATALPVAAVKNVFEEFVWRGLLVTQLVRQRMSDGWIYLVCGGVWGLWHLPYYFRFVPTEQLDAVLPVPRPVFAALAVVTMLGWGVLFVEVYRLSGTIWVPVLMHAVEDALVNPLVLDGHVHFTSTAVAVVFSPVVGLATAAMYAGLGMAVRTVRIRRDTASRISAGVVAATG